MSPPHAVGRELGQDVGGGDTETAPGALRWRLVGSERKLNFVEDYRGVEVGEARGRLHVVGYVTAAGGRPPTLHT